MIASLMDSRAALSLFSFAMLAVGAWNTARADYVPLTDVVQIATGDRHSCAITDAGGVLCWGMNAGTLGTGDMQDRSMPTAVVGLSQGVKAIVAGGWHTCALTIDGNVKCWGNNSLGQLGDGTTTTRLTPVDVPALGAGVKSIAAGNMHTCAVTAANRAMCWGYNMFGQLGDDTYYTRLTPVELQTIVGVEAVTAGFNHTCALGMGSVACWGSDGSTTHTAPYPMVGLETGVRSIDAGLQHTCATMANGSVKCWGSNFTGELGDGTTTWRSNPVDVVGLGGTVQYARAGGGYTCALLDSGSVECWGGNFYGNLGDGTTQNSLVPTPVHDLVGALAVDAGYTHACAVTGSLGAVCWGDDFYGQLGNAMTTQRLSAVDVVGIGPVNTVSMGFRHACALTSTSAVACWGLNYFGQLGDGTTIQRLLPTEVTALGSGIRSVSAGHHHSCAVDSWGRVECWGGNEYGQLGDGSAANQSTPVPVTGMGTDNSVVIAGDYHTCAITAHGGVKCWGNNNSGQLGDGSTTQRDTPVDVIGLTTGVRALAAGRMHTCALMQNGSVKCWGDNWSNEIGSGGATTQTTPVDVLGLAGVSAISAAMNATCAIMVAGTVKCWGTGILGDGGPARSSATPVDVIGLPSGVLAITQGLVHTCAILADGVKCWGKNSAGELGDGSRETRLVPTDVGGLSGRMHTISAGGQTTCASNTAGAVRCWGYNGSGQIGDGTFEGIALPQTVVVPGDSIFHDAFE